MKTKPSQPMRAESSQRVAPSEPSESKIRECAYGLYEKAYRQHGHDVDHWIEAVAFLKARAVRASTNSFR
jgi:hypothetical protein